VELLICLAILYGLQCLTWLPRGAQLFVQPLRGWLVSSGPGWRLLHPWPSGRAFLAMRFPLVEHEGRLHGRGGVCWYSTSGWGSRSLPVDRAALDRAAVQGSVVRIDGWPLARGLSATHTEALAAVLRDLAEARGEGQRERVERTFERDLSLARFAEAKARVDGATRWLAWTSDIYWIGLFVLLPASVFRFGDQRGLLLALPVLAALHLCTLVCFARAHRRLLPDRTGSLVESLATAACYPPLLLRGHHKLRTEVLAGFHPAVVVAAVLPLEPAKAFLRAELVRTSARADEASGSRDGVGLDELELGALRKLLGELGESEEAVLASPPRRDPFAKAYCPACLCDYRSTVGQCTDCCIAVVPYAS